MQQFIIRDTKKKKPSDDQDLINEYLHKRKRRSV